MDPHRVDVLDRADDDAVVRVIADHLHLELLPAEHAFLDQHLPRRRGIEAALDDLDELLLVVGDAPAGAAEGERGPNDRRQADLVERRKAFGEVVGHDRARRFEADPRHRLAEQRPIFRLVDGLGLGTDHLDAVLLQDTLLVQRERGIERGLAAHGRQQRVGPFGGYDLGDDLGRDRLDISGIGELGVGHDRRRVGVDQHDPVALLLQSLAGLCARVIELACLPDDDRAGANDEDGFYVGAFWHVEADFYCSTAGLAIGPPPLGTSIPRGRPRSAAHKCSGYGTACPPGKFRAPSRPCHRRD